jgi:CRISPR-associated endoribonuclease Cas6
LRVTTLNEEMSNAVQEDILPHLPQSLTLRGIEFRIEAYTLDPADHPWAGQATYGELVQGSKGYSRYVTLEFASPTAFRSEGADIALPVPSHVFRGYWQKWNAFAPEPLCIDETWPQFAAACVMVNMLENLHTEKVYFADGTRGAVVGFEGKAGFALLSQKQCGEWAAIWEGASQVLQTLARFAFYCGTGHHTTTGLGQTRLVAGAGDKVKR